MTATSHTDGASPSFTALELLDQARVALRNTARGSLKRLLVAQRIDEFLAYKEAEGNEFITDEQVSK